MKMSDLQKLSLESLQQISVDELYELMSNLDKLSWEAIEHADKVKLKWISTEDEHDKETLYNKMLKLEQYWMLSENKLKLVTNLIEKR